MDSVNWLDAMNFCDKLSQKMGRTYRLPSEAEWELACRARTTTAFAFGEMITSVVANYKNSFRNMLSDQTPVQTTSVASFPPNSFGLYDMHGNLDEWCLDEWVDNYRGAVNYRQMVNIRSRDSKKNRVLRGGSWQSLSSGCQSDSRTSSPASRRDSDKGFRVVSVLSQGLLRPLLF